MLCEIYGIKSLNTIDNHVESLIKRGVVTDVKNLTSVMMPDSRGRECVKTTLYDLKVFNFLAMIFINVMNKKNVKSTCKEKSNYLLY